MAGATTHSARSYLARPIKFGEAVVVARQVGDGAAAEGPVDRMVVRVVKPRTDTDRWLMVERPTRC